MFCAYCARPVSDPCGLLHRRLAPREPPALAWEKRKPERGRRVNPDLQLRQPITFTSLLRLRAARFPRTRWQHRRGHAYLDPNQPLSALKSHASPWLIWCAECRKKWCLPIPPLRCGSSRVLGRVLCRPSQNMKAPIKARAVKVAAGFG